MTIGASVDVVSGKLIDDVTRREIAPEEARSGIIFAGTWRLVDTSGEEAIPRSASYSWIEPPRTHLRRLTAEDLYDPFARGGTILCRYHAEGQGRAQFSSVRVLPPGWESSVRVARAALRADPELLAGPRLLSVVGGDNPVLAVLAFRKLTDPRSGLLRAAGYTQAAFVYLSMHRTEDAVLQELMRLGPSLADPRFFVLGVCAARLVDPELRSSQQWAAALVASLRAPTDPHVQQLLQAARLEPILQA
ncbi:MAG TPA: hypothetical protein VF516_20525 [Kofleriaceae bacterium]